MKHILAIALATALFPTLPGFAQSNPCEDPVYLKLLEKEIDEMSDREFSVFETKSEACTRYLLDAGRRPPAPAPAGVEAKADTTVRRYRTKGFSLRPHLVASGWYLDDNRFFDESNFGGGFGLGLSWGVSELVTIMLNLDGVGYEDEYASDFVMGYGDLGVRFTFASDRSKFRPFAEVLLTGFGTEHVPYRGIIWDPINPDGAYGGGITLGGGFLHFFNPSLALDLGLGLTFGEVTDIEFGTTRRDVDISSFATRLYGGLAWYPGR